MTCYRFWQLNTAVIAMSKGYFTPSARPPVQLFSE